MGLAEILRSVVAGNPEVMARNERATEVRRQAAQERARAIAEYEAGARRDTAAQFEKLKAMLPEMPQRGPLVPSTAAGVPLGYGQPPAPSLSYSAPMQGLPEILAEAQRRQMAAGR